MKTNETLIDRPEYIKKLQAWKGQSDLVKIVTGVRRCGKSKLFTLFQNRLLTEDKVNDKQIININLEDLVQTRQIGLSLNENGVLVGYNKLLDFVLEQLVPNKINYVFIDEVQLLEHWQQVANALRLQPNVDVYLTGSNAYMFSGDLANAFGGRYVEINMQPFSFKEFCSTFMDRHGFTMNAGKPYSLMDIYQSYLKESGFPQTISFWYDSQLTQDYLLDTVYLNTLQKDVVKRFNIADTNKLESVVRYLFDNIGNETSTQGIVRGLKAAGQSVTVPTVETYIKGLKDSYLLYKCERYDIKGKHFLDSNAKYYVADVGLRAALLGSSDRDMGHILENVVYLELLRRGYRVSVGKVNTKSTTGEGRKNVEVDFVAQKSGGEIEYYQVALYALDEEVLQRELRPLEEIKDNYPKFLLSLDYGNGETNGIKRLNVLDWLIGNN